MFGEKHVLRIPGPTPVPPEVTRAMTHAMIGHRSSDFSALLADVEQRLRPLFGTAGDVAILAGTGTAGLEAAVQNMIRVGEQMLAVSNGNFGDRFADIASRTGARVEVLRYEWGQATDPEDIDRLLTEHPAIKTVLLTHCETSTGVLNDLASIARVVRTHDGHLIVDAVSSFLGAPILMDEWGIDVVVTGSQKALGLPPGITLVACGPRAWERIERPGVGTLYFDLARYRKSLADDTTPWTPPVSLVFGLQASLQLIEEEGVAVCYERHLLLRNMTRAAARAWDMPLFVTEDHYASPTVTTIATPDFDANAMRKVLKNELHIIVAGGQKHMDGKLLRIGHMGYVDAADMLQCIAAMEIALGRIERRIEYGAGVRAAQEVYLNATNSRH